LHHGPSCGVETEDRPTQTDLAENGGDRPATNEPWPGVSQAMCAGQSGMATTRDNGYVYDKPLKKSLQTFTDFETSFNVSLLFWNFFTPIDRFQKKKIPQFSIHHFNNLHIYLTKKIHPYTLFY